MSRKLPVAEILRKSVSLVWEKRAFALAVSWPYALAAALIAAAAGFAPERTTVEESGTGDAIQGIAAFAQGLLLSILAVYWHRNILLHETEAPAVPLRFDAPVWRFIGYMLALALVVFAVTFAGAMAAVALSGGSSGGAATIGLVMIPLVLGAMTLMFRLALALPAAAVGDRKTGLRRSWALTRGNTPRLFAIQLLLFAAAVAAGLLFVQAGEALGEPGLMYIAANFAINWAATLIGLTILSLLYAWFRSNAPPEDAELKA